MSLIELIAASLGVLAVWLICNAATGAWFTGTTGQDKLAAAPKA